MTVAVVLAAGDGDRLGEHTAGVPKPLIPIGGRPLIGYTLEALAEASVEEAIVVVGYRAAQLAAALQEAPPLPIRFAQNTSYLRGASLSLRAAREAAGPGPFLLVMADHLLSAPIIRRLLEAPRGPRSSLVATDAAPWPRAYTEEATRIALAPGANRVERIGKNLHPWDALDTGAFLLAPSAWEAVDTAPADCELSAIFSELARRGELEAVDVSGAMWYDVDTAEDLAAARLLVAGGAR